MYRHVLHKQTSCIHARNTRLIPCKYDEILLSNLQLSTRLSLMTDFLRYFVITWAVVKQTLQKAYQHYAYRSLATVAVTLIKCLVHLKDDATGSLGRSEADI